MKTGLKFQFVTLCIVLAAITVFGLSFFFIRQESDVLLQEMIRRGAAITRNLAIVSTDFLINHDHLALATYVDSTRKNEGVSYSFILDEKGTVIAHSQIDQVGKQYTEPKGIRALANEEILIQNYQEASGQPLVDIAVPIRLRSGLTIGVVHVGMEQRAIDRLVNQALQGSLLIAALLLVAGIGIAILVIQMLLRPVRDLMSGVKALGEGDLNHKIPVRGKNELAILGQAFNEMSEHLKLLYLGMLRAMVKALESRNPLSVGHDQRVSELASRLARHLGLAAHAESIGLAAQLQNLGLISVPDRVLENTGKLTPEEYEQLKQHPRRGAEILSQVQALENVVPLVRHHHERFDGQGYPEGLRGEEIPIGARILAVADAYDAMVSPQKHRAALPPEKALEELRRGANSQFDPNVVAAFMDMLKSSQPKEA